MLALKVSINSVSIWLSVCLGVAAFLPIGLNYLIILGFGLLFISPEWRASRISVLTYWRYLLLGIVVWPGVVWVVHGADVDALTRWGHSVRLVACIVLALTMPIQERKAFLLGFGSGALYAASVVLVHKYFAPLPEWGIWHALLSVRGNASSQKWIMLAMASGIAFWLAWQGRLKHWLRIVFLAAGLLFGALVASISISRNSHLILISVPLFLVCYRYRKPKAWMAAFIGSVGLMCVLWQISPVVQSRFLTAFQELEALVDSGSFDGSVSVRGQMFVTAWQQMWESPLFGVGLGGWSDIWANASQEYPWMAGINNPHNDFLLWGMETGLPGLLILLCFVSVLFVSAWRNSNTLIGGAGWIASMVLLITGMVNAPFRDAALGMSLLILTVALATWPVPSQVEADD